MQIIIHPLSLIPRFWTLHWSLSPMVPSYPVLLFWPYQTWVRYLFDREISHRWLVPKVGTNKFRVKTIEGFRRSSFWGCFFDSHDKVSGLQNCNDASRLGNWFKKVGRSCTSFCWVFWCSLMKMPPHPISGPSEKEGLWHQTGNMQYIFCFFLGSLGMGETSILGLDLGSAQLLLPGVF